MNMTDICQKRRHSHLADVAPALESILMPGPESLAPFSASDIRRETVWVPMRDGIQLATDLYVPPRIPAPAIAMRTPYGRAHVKSAETLIAIARRGYIVVSQDCRGTGESEPDTWDYYVYEREDSFDFVEWISRQPWFEGFLGSCGSSYLAQTQWCMSLHPRMSTVVPEVGGLGVAFHTARLYMFLNAYARSVGRGVGKSPIAYDELERQMLEETLSGGFFNEPLHKPFSDALRARFAVLRSLPPAKGQRWLWEHYCGLAPAERAELIKEALDTRSITITELENLPAVFGQQVAHDAHMFACAQPSDLAQSLKAPALMITGWYDWGLNDALATWELLTRAARPIVSTRSRLLITPSAHNTPGYHEGRGNHPELERNYRTGSIVELLLHWYSSVREGTLDAWPAVIYYLMGANQWQAATTWPPPEAHGLALYFGPAGALSLTTPGQNSTPDSYIYDPDMPTPTVGGSIVSYVYAPGSVDVSTVQRRSDVLVYTTEPLDRSFDVVGPLRVVLYVSSSAVDTDFCARLSDVFPDGRAVQLQNGMLRVRHRDRTGDPTLLTPGRIYCIEIDMWATANRFGVGHRLRLDISSADFPRFDRNANRGGESGASVRAVQTIYHDLEHPSHLSVSILETPLESRGVLGFPDE
jgi:predicted acyl esterase